MQKYDIVSDFETICIPKKRENTPSCDNENYIYDDTRKKCINSAD